MGAKGQIRGHAVEWDESAGIWRWQDNGSPMLDDRACKSCAERPTREGHDPCLGELPGVSGACCGHGLANGSLVTVSGIRLEFCGAREGALRALERWRGCGDTLGGMGYGEGNAETASEPLAQTTP